MMRLRHIAERIELKPLRDTPEVDRLRIREIRNQPAVRSNMYTSHEISHEEHQAWLERLETDPSTRFFAVLLDGALIGGVSLYSINEANKRAEWALYLDESAQGGGLGAALEFRFLDYAFGDAGLQKLNCEVLAFNVASQRLHRKFGFVEEGVRRAHIIRDGAQIDTHLLGITAAEWASRRAQMLQGAFR